MKRTDGAHVIVPIALVALAAVAAHATALAGGFVWLDHAHIEEGLALAEPSRWPSLFVQGFAGTGFYRPLMSLSLSIDAALGGSAWLFHVTTLLWHAAAAGMTVAAAQALGLTRRAAIAAGLLFAVHPATSLVASATAFRSEAMIAVALLALVVAHRRRRPGWAAAALLAGALSKETALVLAPLFIVAMELDSTPGGAGERRARLRLLAAEGGALAAAFGLRLAFAPAWRAAFAPLAPGEAVATRLAALGRTALLAAVPIDRHVCDAFPIASLSSPWAALGAVMAVALAFLAWRRRGPALLLALALLPSLNLVPVMRWWSPHYLYVPLAFAAMLAAQAAEALAARLGKPAWAGAAVAALVLAAITARDDLRFRTDVTLWRPEIAAQPGCREGQFYLGEAAREQTRWAEAVERYGAAIETRERILSYVDRGSALQNLGAVHLQQGNLGEARAAFEAALGVVSNEDRRRRVTHNLATAELRAGDAAAAARLLEPETSRDDALPESLFVRSRALGALGRNAEAEALAQRLEARRLVGQAP